MNREWLKDVPEWVQKATYHGDLSYEELLEQVNFLRGSFLGHSGKIAELEEQVKIARKYQQELDAQTADACGDGFTAKQIRSQEI